MTVARQIEVQAAVWTRLTGALSAPVFDCSPRRPPRLFVRLDGAQVIDQSPKNCDHGQHVIRLSTFSRPRGDDEDVHGQREIKELQAEIDAALHGWAPFAGEAEIYRGDCSVMPDEDGHTQHGLQTFYLEL